MVKATGLAALGIAILAQLAQAELPRNGSAMTIEPRAFVTLQVEAGAGDIVQVQAASGTYGQKRLEAVAQEISGTLGGKPRSFEYIDSGPGKEEKAFFIVDGLVNGGEGGILLQPLVRALMKGADAKFVDAFKIRVIGVRPSAYSTLAVYTSSVVDLRAHFEPGVPAIEYRIAVRTADPTKVAIPPKYIPLQTVVDADQKKENKTWLVVLLVIAAGGSAGALVYFALLGKGA